MRFDGISDAGAETDLRRLDRGRPIATKTSALGACRCRRTTRARSPSSSARFTTFHESAAGPPGDPRARGPCRGDSPGGVDPCRGTRRYSWRLSQQLDLTDEEPGWSRPTPASRAPAGSPARGRVAPSGWASLVRRRPCRPPSPPECATRGARTPPISARSAVVAEALAVALVGIPPEYASAGD